MKVTDKITITNEDNMLMMSRYPDNYFDLAIVDPPYGIDADKKQNAAAEARINANGTSKAGRGWKQYKITEWDSDIPKDEYFIELFRISKNQIIWGGNYFPFIWGYGDGVILWNKMQREFSLADGEMAWSNRSKAMRIFDMSRGKALAHNNREGGRLHPTQKPTQLYEWLLDNYAKEGDKILDTHLGSGSIAIACHNRGFELTACELDKEYYDASIKRFKQQTAQTTIFDLGA